LNGGCLVFLLLVAFESWFDMLVASLGCNKGSFLL